MLSIVILIAFIIIPGPHPEWDPDIVAALDGDFDPDDPDNEMDDDFMLKVWLWKTDFFQFYKPALLFLAMHVRRHRRWKDIKTGGLLSSKL